MQCHLPHVQDTFWTVPDRTPQLYWKAKPAYSRLPYKYTYMSSELGAPETCKMRKMSSIFIFPG